MFELRDWFCNIDAPGKIYGKVYNSPRPDGHLVVTSRVVGITADGIITTKSGTKYKLVNPAPEYEARFPNALQRLIESFKP